MTIRTTRTICSWCGRKIERPRSHAKSEFNFCGIKCLREWEFGIEPFLGLQTIRKRNRIVKCEWCGKNFRRRNYRKDRKQYCSRQCYLEVKANSRKRNMITCAVCGKKVWRPPSSVKRTKIQFCSAKCCNESRMRRVEIRCAFCGKPRIKVMHQFKGTKRHFCSKLCAYLGFSGENHPLWKGGKDLYYGPNWSRQSKKAVRRDKMCMNCKRRNCRLDAHHIIPFDHYGLENYVEANRMENLLTLCDSCHRKIHFGKISVEPPQSLAKSIMSLQLEAIS